MPLQDGNFSSVICEDCERHFDKEEEDYYDDEYDNCEFCRGSYFGCESCN